MQVIGYENNHRVTVKKRFQNNEGDFKLTQPLMEAMDILMVDKPLWTFRVEQPYMGNVATDITVIQDDEELGVVCWKWTGGEHKYFVSNDRINDARQRGRGYATKNKDKAVNKVKKMFSVQTMAEKLAKAQEEAESALSSTHSRKHREAYQVRAAVDKQALTYVQTVGWEMFLEYVQNHDVNTYNTISKRDELQEESAYMASVGDAFQKGNALLVVQEGSRYIVKSKDGVQIHSDSDLPDHMRPKLGMLKLVEKENYITGSGFKVGDNMFVITPEKENGEV